MQTTSADRCARVLEVPGEHADRAAVAERRPPTTSGHRRFSDTSRVAAPPLADDVTRAVSPSDAELHDRSLVTRRRSRDAFNSEASPRRARTLPHTA
jgi:hypothetical protein